MNTISNLNVISQLKRYRCLSLKDSFNKLTPGKQREYLEHVSLAKTEETRIRRVQNSVTNIKAGKGLNDKYK